ncbi:MAG: sodium:calcium symporter [Bacteroides sp. SM23_62_1]|nr:MAG: sodium:calcium symporter [Bacteroides sp. SM23_62_1]
MANLLDNSVNQRFSSRLGLLLSALGIAVGTGNIWRFPRIAAQSGGDTGAGAFLIAWLIFLFLWSIPLIIAEYALGRKFRAGVIGIFLKAVGQRLSWMGTFVAFVSTAIAFFYTVVVGWCIYYFIHTLTHQLPLTTEASLATWNTYQQSGWRFLFHFLAVGLGAMAIWKGINSIERVNKILIPVLLIIVIISVIRAVTLPGAFDGVKYLFTPEWSQLLRPETWLAALTQNAWDTGAGWGLFLTYAAYMQSRHKVVKNAFLTGIGNNTVSLLAAIMIFGTVFSVLQIEMGMSDAETLEIMRSSGPASTGLTFIWMPQLFARMFMGTPLAILFFLGLTFAGFSSVIAMLELAARVLVDTGLKRSQAIIIIVLFIYLLGLPSTGNLNILSNQDYVWGIGLMISGAFIAFAVMKNKTSVISAEINTIPNDWKTGWYWSVIIRIFIPFAAFILLVWWMFLSATVFAPDDWYNPFNPFSIMTCLVQWFLVLGVFIVFNRKISGLIS